MVDCRRETNMVDQLSERDWLDLGLKMLARHGFTALKADPLAKTMGVSRGSFYWHFANVEAFHTALLRHWREVTVEDIIRDVQASASDRNALPVLLRRVFSAKPPPLERAVRNWATFDPAAAAAVRTVDRSRLNYVESLLAASGLSADTARARAQILYWAFLGFASSDQILPRARHAKILDELLRMAAR
jgi:AcrR family transcriptional regulator